MQYTVDLQIVILDLDPIVMKVTKEDGTGLNYELICKELIVGFCQRSWFQRQNHGLEKMPESVSKGRFDVVFRESFGQAFLEDFP